MGYQTEHLGLPPGHAEQGLEPPTPLGFVIWREPDHHEGIAGYVGPNLVAALRAPGAAFIAPGVWSPTVIPVPTPDWTIGRILLVLQHVDGQNRHV